MQFERIDASSLQWQEILSHYRDKMLYQTPAWLAFLAQTQGGEIVRAALKDGRETVGHFSGMLIHNFGVRVLGSPFPGWTTSYMGINLRPGISRREALVALRRFAFADLGCVHLEIMDRYLTTADLGDDCEFDAYEGFEVDLSASEDDLFKAMASPCQRCIRKAVRSGVSIRQATDETFADDYYDQLREVFAKQGLIPTYSIERVRALLRHLLPTGDLLLLRAISAEGHCIATAILPGKFNHAFFWGGASRREHQILRPNELIMWEAMKIWKERGIRFLDMGGRGDYKRKYGGVPISVPWVRSSRYPLLSSLRSTAKQLVKMRQRFCGWWQEGGRTPASSSA